MALNSYFPTTAELIADKQRRTRVIIAALIATVIIVFGIMGGLLFFLPKVSGYVAFAVGCAAFIMIAIPVLVWNKPDTGIYILVLASILLADTRTGSGPTIIFAYAPVWQNLSTLGRLYGTNALKPLSFSPVEVLMVITTLAWLVRSIASRSLHLRSGSFLGWILLYSLFVVWGYLHGMTSGGNNTMALYEVRAQAYVVLSYILATNMLTTKKQIRTFLWCIIIGAGLLGLFGFITYLQLHGDVTVMGFMAHDDTLYFDRLLLLTFILMMVAINKRMRIWSIIFAPTALITLFANQRRASIAAFLVAFLPMLPLLWLNFKERRKQIMAFTLTFVVISAIYLPIAWNASGAWALPARAIRSQSDPNARDESSDYYRLAETADLKMTRDAGNNAWLGFGYGKPFIMYVPLPNLTTDFLFYMPHNSVLWVWMRLGNIGFFAFLMMIVAVFIRGPQIIMTVKDPYLKIIGLLAILDVLMIYIYGQYDLQLVNGRQMFYTFAMLGVLGALPEIDKNKE
jgi:hypothetical protein